MAIEYRSGSYKYYPAEYRSVTKRDVYIFTVTWSEDITGYLHEPARKYFDDTDGTRTIVFQGTIKFDAKTKEAAIKRINSYIEKDLLHVYADNEHFLDGSIAYPDNERNSFGGTGSTQNHDGRYTDISGPSSRVVQELVSYAYCKVIDAPLVTSGTDVSIPTEYSNRVLLSKDGVNFTYYSSANVTSFFNNTNTNFYVAILDYNGDVLGLVNNTTVTKDNLNLLYDVRTSSLENIYSNISGTILPGKETRYSEIYTTGINNYNEVKTYLAENLKS